MNILVCIKQVPGSSNVEVDPVTGVLKRDGVASKMNPYDLYGLELAMSLTEAYGGEVKTVTMGPPPCQVDYCGIHLHGCYVRHGAQRP